jgi:metallo-beta-lactamase family protein
LLGQRLFSSLDIVETRTPDESKSLNDRIGPFVIVSASGMATGGRVLHHLANRIGDSRNSVLLVGFQAPGTRGDKLRHGASSLRMFGHDYPVAATIESVEMSAHADRSELIDWLATASVPDLVLVNHGELEAAESLAEAVRHQLHLPAAVPAPGEQIAVGVSARIMDRRT